MLVDLLHVDKVPGGSPQEGNALSIAGGTGGDGCEDFAPPKMGRIGQRLPEDGTGKCEVIYAQALRLN